ncbi:hypothetical protein DFR52_102735 [Hoeflea marina]|uniref:DUF3329 domain-containing protein n=1 Tax=Hoeflea marina TaxID=274592 RepID=A0A317PPJ6_9HYPH|nr:hypothetical protein [Hoeflea marina]PWW02069.1 hypothetical protein DFR52_102735 [Hoeflea marina]
MTRKRKPLKIIDFSHPFYRPKWRRVAILVVTVLWTLMEFATGNPAWGTGAALLSAYLVWGFFLVPLPEPPVEGAVADPNREPEDRS